MRVDTHVHFWRKGDGHRVLIRERLAELDRDFTWEALAPQLAAAKVDRIVLVSAAQEAAETDMLLAAARENPERILGVVGWLDLQAADSGKRLAARVADPAFIGLRLPLTILADPRWILRDDVRRSLAALADTGCIAEILARPDQLADVAEVAEALPGLRVLIDHCANPNLDAPEPEWAPGMARLGARPNTWVKIAAFWAPGQPPVQDEAVLPVFGTVLEAFPSARRLAAANWPVSSLGMDYTEPWARLERLTGRLGLGEPARRQLFGENALALVSDIRTEKRKEIP